MAEKFDWYQTTLRGSDPQAIGLDRVLLDHFDLADYRPARPRNGYLKGAQIARGSHECAHISWGGQPGINVVSTSDDAPILFEALKVLKVVHRPTRIDTSIDFDEEGLFDVLARRLVKFAKAKDLAIDQQGDWSRKKGRTLYLGSPASPVRLVIYEKGYEQGIDKPGWVRIEARIRPQKDARDVVMHFQKPEDVFSCGWLTEALDAIGYHHRLKKQAIGTVWRPSDGERARFALIKQYGAVLRNWASDLGGWQHMAQELAHRIQTQGSEIENWQRSQVAAEPAESA